MYLKSNFAVIKFFSLNNKVLISNFFEHFKYQKYKTIQR